MLHPKNQCHIKPLSPHNVPCVPIFTRSLGRINQFKTKNSFIRLKTKLPHYYTQQINNLRLQWSSANLL